MSGPVEHGCLTRLHERLETERQRGVFFHHHEVHALFEELIHRPWKAACWNPPVDISENEDRFIIEMDLPGTQADKVTIRAQGKILTIEGQRERRQYVRGTSAHLHERCEGRFSRSFEFDFNIGKETIEDHWQDGVLTLIVPKPKKKA